MSNGEIILYNTEDGASRIRLRSSDGSVWLTQAEIAELFQTTKQNVSLHLKNVFDDGELAEESVVKESLTTAADGKSYQTKAYRLEAILAVGYRVRSPRGTQFRRWATTTLREYLVKGFTLDDERLKEPAGGWDYFDELLERIRSIRASEKRFYQKVRDLFTTSADYDGKDQSAQVFFKTIQNKMIFAVTGKTAAELILARADATKSNMGLTTWQKGRVLKGDVFTAKNYLAETEAAQLDRLVSAFLDLAEDRASRRQQTTMAEWMSFVDSYLKLADREILTHAGRISHEKMEEIIGKRYTVFDAGRREGERLAAEAEHVEEIDSELKKVTKQLEVTKPARKHSGKKEGA
jgi:hypothetical protein